jgi:hypothetical protein
MQGNQIDRKSINGDLLWFHPASAGGTRDANSIFEK